MGVTSTDDRARMLPFKYLGPPGYRWPAATIAAYATFASIALAGIVLGFITRPNIGTWLFFEVPGSVIGGLLITRFVFRHITPDRNVRYQIATLQAELRAPRPAEKATTYVAAVPAHVFTDHHQEQRR